MRADIQRHALPLFVEIPAAWLAGFRALYPPLARAHRPPAFALPEDRAPDPRLRQPRRYHPERPEFYDRRRDSLTQAERAARVER